MRKNAAQWKQGTALAHRLNRIELLWRRTSYDDPGGSYWCES
jgi:hypothetical protein